MGDGAPKKYRGTRRRVPSKKRETGAPQTEQAARDYGTPTAVLRFVGAARRDWRTVGGVYHATSSSKCLSRDSKGDYSAAQQARGTQKPPHAVAQNFEHLLWCLTLTPLGRAGTIQSRSPGDGVVGRLHHKQEDHREQDMP